MSYHNLKKQRYISKIVLLGNDNVGKTSLCLKFIKNIFRINVESTIGVNFYTKILQYHGNQYKLVLWDTAGHERFRSILTNYYKLADLYILMFDLSNKKSFESLPYWLNQIEINNPVENNKIIVLGNKSDKDIKVSKDLIKNFTDSYNLPVLEISTKEGINLLKMENTIYKNIEVIVNNKTLKNIKNSNDLAKNENEQDQLCFNLCNIL
jgi:Ras-related protein Rab-1A